MSIKNFFKKINISIYTDPIVPGSLKILKHNYLFEPIFIPGKAGQPVLYADGTKTVVPWPQNPDLKNAWPLIDQIQAKCRELFFKKFPHLKEKEAASSTPVLSPTSPSIHREVTRILSDDEKTPQHIDKKPRKE